MKQQIHDVLLNELCRIGSGEMGDTSLIITRFIERVLRNSDLNPQELQAAEDALHRAYARCDTEYTPTRFYLSTAHYMISGKVLAELRQSIEEPGGVQDAHTPAPSETLPPKAQNRYTEMFERAAERATREPT